MIQSLIWSPIGPLVPSYFLDIEDGLGSELLSNGNFSTGWQTQTSLQALDNERTYFDPYITCYEHWIADWSDTTVAAAIPDIPVLPDYPSGNWTTGGVNLNVVGANDANISYPGVDGELCRFEWSDLHTSATTYDFTIVLDKISDAQALGKHITIAVIDAHKAPEWLKSITGTFTYDLQTVSQTAPLPWHPAYVINKRNFINALANAIGADNPTVKGIYFSYAAMTNGIEFHWHVDEAEYAAAGYTYAGLIDAAKSVFNDMHTAFPNKPIIIEGHTVWDSTLLWEDLIAHAYSVIGDKLMLAAWWLCRRIVENTSGNDDEAAIWPIMLDYHDMGCKLLGQTIANFSEQPYRFDADNLAGWTVTGDGWHFYREAYRDGEVVDSSIEQADIFESGKTYRVTYQTKNTASGAVEAYIGDEAQRIDDAGNAGLDMSHSYDITTTQSGKLLLKGVSSFDGTIDNVSVRELLSNSGTSQWLFPTGKVDFSVTVDFNKLVGVI